MTDDREIRETPTDRAAVLLIAERLLKQRQPDGYAPIASLDVLWRRKLAPMAHALTHAQLDEHLAWFETPPAPADADAFARAHGLLTLVSHFKAEGDFRRMQERAFDADVGDI